jgi:hypothetical protein
VKIETKRVQNMRWALRYPWPVLDAHVPYLPLDIASAHLVLGPLIAQGELAASSERAAAAERRIAELEAELAEAIEAVAAAKLKGAADAQRCVCLRGRCPPRKDLRFRRAAHAVGQTSSAVLSFARGGNAKTAVLAPASAVRLETRAQAVAALGSDLARSSPVRAGRTDRRKERTGLLCATSMTGQLALVAQGG